MDAALRAAVLRDDASAVEHCLAAGANLATAVDGTGASALHVAANLGLVAMTKLLLRHGAPVNARTNFGSTPLHWANGVECCDVLVLAGADVDAVNERHENALHWAAWYGTLEQVPRLVAAGADPRCRDLNGETPAEIARRGGDLPAAALLDGAAAAHARWSGLRQAVITAWCSRRQ